MAEVKLTIHDILRADTQVNQAYGGKGVMGCTDYQYTMFLRRC